MYTFSNQITIECCLSISICFMLLFWQSITSQTSITFLFVLNYEFPLVFPFPFVFAIPFIPLLFPFPTIPDPIPFPIIKCGYGNERGVFRPFSSLDGAANLLSCWSLSPPQNSKPKLKYQPAKYVTVGCYDFYLGPLIVMNWNLTNEVMGYAIF
jgi:hypothetical protein